MTNTPVYKKCDYCGKQFRVKLSHFDVTVYCSKTCMANGYSIRMRGSNNPHFSDAAKRICQRCGDEFHSYNKASKYCSQFCYHASKTIDPDRYTMQREWKKNNRKKVSNYSRVRRSLRAALPTEFTENEWEECFQYWNGCCAYCGNSEGLFPNSKIQRDHYIPIAAQINNPGHVATNIVPACCSCNTSKSDAHPETWALKRFGKRKSSKIIQQIKQYFTFLDEGGLK